MARTLSTSSIPNTTISSCYLVEGQSKSYRGSRRASQPLHQRNYAVLSTWSLSFGYTSRLPREEFLGETVAHGLTWKTRSAVALGIIGGSQAYPLCVAGPRIISFPQKQQHRRLAHGRSGLRAFRALRIRLPVGRPAGRHLQTRLQSKGQVSSCLTRDVRITKQRRLTKTKHDG